MRHLVNLKKRAVAPMLISGGLYSNFWAGMTDYYYQRTDQYKLILQRKEVGCFQVPMIHSAVLLDLRYKSLPSFVLPQSSNDSHPVPEDDIIRFAINAKDLGIPLEICNDLEYGAVLAPLDEETDLARDDEQLYNLRIEVSGKYFEIIFSCSLHKIHFTKPLAYWYPPMRVGEDLQQWAQVDPSPTTLGFEQVYLINLKRRPDRLAKMKEGLKILGIDYEVLEATDGK